MSKHIKYPPSVFGGPMRFAWTFSYFGWCTKCHQSQTDISKSALALATSLFTISSQIENYFVVKLRGFFRKLVAIAIS